MNDIVYRNVREVEGLISNTYILAVIAAIVFIAFSLLAAQLIAYQGGKNPRDPVKRRVWFWILAVLNVILFFAWNYFFVLNKIKPVPALQDKFLINSAIATGVTLVVYFLVGFLLSKLIKKGKYGTIFPSKN